MGFGRGAVGIEDNVRELCPGVLYGLVARFVPFPLSVSVNWCVSSGLSAVDERNNFNAPLFVSDPV
jgi:hypothetical protein